MTNVELDPRIIAIRESLKDIGNTIVIMSSKGGVGKTLISSLMALSLSLKGSSVGLLDLDITNPSCHLVLGINISSIKPIEEKGIIPPIIHGIKFLSIVFYSEDKPLSLRGSEIDYAIKELLAITRWGKTSYLIVDSPPGISDEALDILSYLIDPRIILVTTPSPLSIKSIERMIVFLKDSGEKIIGLIENMANKPTNPINKICRDYNIQYLGNIPFDKYIDNCIGDINCIKTTLFYRSIEGIMNKIT